MQHDSLETGFSVRGCSCRLAAPPPRPALGPPASAPSDGGSRGLVAGAASVVPVDRVTRWCQTPRRQRSPRPEDTGLVPSTEGR